MAIVPRTGAKEKEHKPMTIKTETALRDFQFWSGAADRVKYLTGEELDTIEEMLNDCNPEGMSETEVNDLFWFDEDTVAEWLGYNSFDEIMEREAAQ
jgi:hypothetical protein